jgi:hypothetical protein
MKASSSLVPLPRRAQPSQAHGGPVQEGRPARWELSQSGRAARTLLRTPSRRAMKKLRAVSVLAPGERVNPWRTGKNVRRETQEGFPESHTCGRPTFVRGNAPARINQRLRKSRRRAASMHEAQGTSRTRHARRLLTLRGRAPGYFCSFVAHRLADIGFHLQ